MLYGLGYYVFPKLTGSYPRSALVRVPALLATRGSCATSNLSKSMGDLHKAPMRRHLTNPLHAGVLHGRIGVQAAGHGASNQRLPLFLQKLDKAGFFGDQGVDANVFGVQRCGYYRLLTFWRCCDCMSS